MEGSHAEVVEAAAKAVGEGGGGWGGATLPSKKVVVWGLCAKMRGQIQPAVAALVRNLPVALFICSSTRHANTLKHQAGLALVNPAR